MSIFGKKSVLMNVCPKMTREELYRRTDPTFGRPSQPHRQDFAKELVYGAYEEVVWLEPGDRSEPLDESAAIALAKEHKSDGIIIVDDGRDLLEQKIAGLDAAIEFHNLRGDQAMAPFITSMTEEQRRLNRRVLWGILLNQTREKVLREYRDQLLGFPAPVAEVERAPKREAAPRPKKEKKPKRVNMMTMPCGKEINAVGQAVNWHKKGCAVCSQPQAEANAAGA